jgi:hypothetical protein
LLLELPMDVRRWVLYPFLLAAYPVLSLYAQNSYDAPPAQLVGPIILMVAGSVVVWMVLSGVLRDPARAGLLTVLALVVFDTLAMMPEWVDKSLGELSDLWVRRVVHVWPPLVIGVELVAALLVARVLARTKNAAAWTSRLNLFAVVLVSMPLSSIVAARMRESVAASTTPPAAPASGGPSGMRRPTDLIATARAARRPDIYYIILDGYARSDVMKDRFGFDNSPFLERLEQKGFFVARQSTANYCQTPLSLSSSLNSAYLNDWIPADSHDKCQLSGWIGDGRVVRTLRGLGYRYVTFSTGFEETEHPEADVYLSPAPYCNPFHQLLLSRTPLVPFLTGPGLIDEYTAARDRTLYLLKTVPEIARRDGPTFTFAHILSPHPPFVFDENGADVSPHERRYYLTDGDLYRGHYGDRASYAEGYRKQATFLTGQVERMIDGILANSPEPPLIILQSDHGSGMDLETGAIAGTDLGERMSILNAYYFPGPGRQALYPSITPVNSLRVLLRAYFGADMELLPDHSYFSTWGDPFRFIDVSDRVRPGGRACSSGD